MRYGRSDETDDCYLHSAAIEHGVGLEVWFSGFDAYGICSQHGEVAIGHIAVEHLMPRLEVVVADNGYIIADEVAEVGHTVMPAFAYEVEIIRCRLALQHVATINQDGAAGFPLTLLCHEGIHSLQAAFAPARMSEIERKIVAMYIACENDSYFTSFFHRWFIWSQNYQKSW